MKSRKIAVWGFVMVLAWAGPGLGDLSSGLVAYYPFNGNANDESGNGNNGTVYGATLTVDRLGNLNSAYSFDGIDDYVLVPDSDSLDLTTTGTVAPSGTLAAWVNVPTGARDDFTAIVVKMGWSSGGGSSYELLNRLIGWDTPERYGSYQTLLGIAHDSSHNLAAYSARDISDGKWHHVAFVWDVPVAILYLDGKNATEETTSGTGAKVTDFDLHIGRYHYDPHGGWDSWDGLIDDVRIYNRALSGAEVQELSVVPVPGAAALCVLGIGVASGFLRRRTAGA